MNTEYTLASVQQIVEYKLFLAGYPAVKNW